MEGQRLPLMFLFLIFLTIFVSGCSGKQSLPSEGDVVASEVPPAEVHKALPTSSPVQPVLTVVPTEAPSATPLEEVLSTSEPENVPVVDSLCREQEEVILSCRIASNHKLLSICGSAELTQAYVQYRFGSSPEIIELAYPEEIQNSQQAFLFARYTRPVVTYLSLSFDISQYLFDVYDESNGESGQTERRVGVRVTEADGQQSDFVCSEPIISELSSLEDIIPNGPWPPVSPLERPKAEDVPESLPVEDVGYAERATWIEFLKVPSACQEEFQWNDNIHQEQNYSGLTFYPLEADKYVVEVQCDTFAYAYSFRLYLYDRGHGTSKVLRLPEVDPETKTLIMQESSYGSGLGFDEATKRFTNFQKGRGLGDCGIFYHYEIKADQLSLLEARYRSCDIEGEDYIEPTQWEHIYP